MNSNSVARDNQICQRGTTYSVIRSAVLAVLALVMMPQSAANALPLYTVTAFGVNTGSAGPKGIAEGGLVASGIRHPMFVTKAYRYQPSAGVVELGTLGGTSSIGYAINELGQVTGSSLLSSGQQHAFLYSSNGPMVDLGTLGGTQSEGSDINNSGQIAGSSLTSAGIYHAFRYDSGGTMVDLGSLIPNGDSAARGINASGQVIGSAQVYGGTHAFRADPGNPLTDLGTLGGANSDVLAINDAGQVTGGAQVPSGYTHAYRHDGTGPMVDLGTLGGNESQGAEINNAGVVVGSAANGADFFHAFIADGVSPMLDLGTFGGNQSNGLDINDVGQAVGSAETSDLGVWHAFLYDPGEGMIDLNALILSLDPSLTGWNFWAANGITNDGHILVLGEDASRTVNAAFLLSPSAPNDASEPNSLLLFGASLVAIGALFRRK